MTNSVGIIGGSGIYDSGLFTTREVHKVSTPWGAPSGFIEEGEIGGVPTFFLPRHAKGHTIPAHKVNYKANIDAMKSLGIDVLVTVNSVGSLREELPPGAFVIPDQFIDMTKNRLSTFYDGGKTYHVSTADPFCPALTGYARQLAASRGTEITFGKTYVCIEGPRFSTRAESKFFRGFADIIGMTLCPEAQLAREREMCYLPLCMVTDYDVWAEHPVEATDIVRTLTQNVSRARDLIKALVPVIATAKRDCTCGKALEMAGI